jgi:purine-binding chemotaxis protein CheW
MLDDQLYAMPVTHVREVQIVPELTRVPNMLPYMRGIINLRESAVPVIDLKICFDLGETDITSETAVIIIERIDKSVPKAEKKSDGSDVENEAAETTDKNTENNTAETEGKKSVLGLFSDSVKQVLSIEPSFIQQPPKVGTSIDASYISGIARIENQFIILLDIEKILHSSIFENAVTCNLE